MADWLAVLLAPQTVVRQRAIRSAALLLDGRYWEYQHEYAERGWPALIADLPDQPTIELEFVRALIRHFVSGEDAAAQYAAIAASRRAPSTLKTVASVLQGVFLADSNRQAEAIEALAHRDMALHPGLEQALVRLHLGLRYAEFGEFGEAIKIDESARSILHRQDRSQPAVDALVIVAKSNRWRFYAETGRILRPSRGPFTSIWLSRIDALRAEALERNLFEQFEGAARDATEFSVSLRSEDPVEASLRRALLRAECFASWEHLVEVRRELGRYRILSLVGSVGRQPEAGFHLLRRAADHDALRRSGRLYLQLGPLRPLARVGVEFAELPEWLPSEVRSIATLLGVAADVLELNSASNAIRRVAEWLSTMPVTGRNWAVVDELLVAAANLTFVTPPEAHAELARSVNALMARPGLDAIAGHVGECLRLIRWDQINQHIREESVRIAISSAQQPESAAIGLSACRALAKVDHRCAELLLERFRRQPSVDLGSAVLGADIDLSPQDERVLIEVCMARLGEIRTAAATHQFTLFAVDAAALLSALLTSHDARAVPTAVEGWDALADFLADQNLPSEMKASAFDILGDRISAVDRALVTQIGESALLASERPDSQGFFDSPLRARGRALRFALLAGMLSSTEALTSVLALAASSDPRGRMEAADCTVSALTVKPELAVITLAVSLTQDQHHQVRAAAGRALAELGGLDAGSLRGVVRERMRALLREDGAAVPRATIQGILKAAQSGTRPEVEVVEILRRMASSHPAASVRYIAAEALRAI